MDIEEAEGLLIIAAENWLDEMRTYIIPDMENRAGDEEENDLHETLVSYRESAARLAEAIKTFQLDRLAGGL